MIYSAAFDALPRLARQAIYRHLWTLLSGQPVGVDAGLIVDMVYLSVMSLTLPKKTLLAPHSRC
jgi:hypothetical protein